MAKLSQKQELQQHLTPQQILKANLLQLNLTLLEQRILYELENNPALELIENIEDVKIVEPNDEVEQELDKQENEVEFEWEELIGEHEDHENPPVNNNSEEIDIPIIQLDTFIEVHLKKLNDINATSKELLIAEEILGNLDGQGYLNIEPLLIADRLNLKEEIVLAVMNKIQKLDPPGLASTNIQECLLIQAEVYKENDLAIIILKKYFDDFVNHRYEKIVEAENCTKEQFNQALEYIARLNPSPRDDQSFIANDIIIPDVVVEEKEGGFFVNVNDCNIPEVQISPSYIEMLKTHKNKKDVYKFVKQKIESANWFIDAISGRKQTIQKVMESIIKRQPDYFQNEQRTLKPMILKDIAKDIDMDISTISRVTSGKYVQLPWEVKELKTFFSEGLRMDSGESISSTRVKERLRQIITEEDKKDPIDDEELTQKLNAEGYKIARRTVAKYREQFQIPTARLRRIL